MTADPKTDQPIINGLTVVTLHDPGADSAVYGPFRNTDEARVYADSHDWNTWTISTLTTPDLPVSRALAAAATAGCDETFMTDDNNDPSDLDEDWYASDIAMVLARNAHLID